VRWFHFPVEVDVCEDFISRAEVFDSAETKAISVEAVIEKVVVLTLAEYNNLDEADECTFFSRASLIRQKIYPPFSKWDRMCVCKEIVNPDKPMVLCETCLEYFHEVCVSSPFSCPSCGAS
jgi:hypothetical protein